MRSVKRKVKKSTGITGGMSRIRTRGRAWQGSIASVDIILSHACALGSVMRDIPCVHTSVAPHFFVPGCQHIHACAQSCHQFCLGQAPEQTPPHTRSYPSTTRPYLAASMTAPAPRPATSVDLANPLSRPPSMPSVRRRGPALRLSRRCGPSSWPCLPCACCCDGPCCCCCCSGEREPSLRVPAEPSCCGCP